MTRSAAYRQNGEPSTPLSVQMLDGRIAARARRLKLDTPTTRRNPTMQQHQCERCAREPRPYPRGLRPACSAGLTLSGTYTIGGRTYRQAYVTRSGKIVWPGDTAFRVPTAGEEGTR